MIKPLRERINDIISQSKHFTPGQLQKAISIQKAKGGELSRVLIDEGLITEKELMVLFSEELKIPAINLAKFKIESDVVKMIPERAARKYQLMPISKVGNNLTVAMVDPLNIMALDDLKILTGCEIDAVLTTREAMAQALEKYYPGEKIDWDKILESASAEGLELVKSEPEYTAAMASESQEAPIVRMVDLILEEALKRRASDIHFEPREKALCVRYRIDGDMEEVFNIPKKNQNAVLTRLKIMSGLDITEFRLPQDGRFKMHFTNKEMESNYSVSKLPIRLPRDESSDRQIAEKEIDYRVSVLPIQYGNKVVLRILDKGNLSIGLDTLGFPPGPIEAFKEAIQKPFGMILITGPTGSGKSTTLYSILNQLNTPARNIMTIEDPVEYLVDGISQLQVKQDIGLTFAAGLRSILRQSPDIIMVGEIRDSETADIAVKASLTGHLVLSTLHTNDAIGAIARLIDMGIEPFLVASAIIMVAAQRLCRRLCANCKEEMAIPVEVLKRAGLDEKPVLNHAYQARGCKECRNTGYFGRMGILEVFLMDDNVRQMIQSGVPIDEIKAYNVGKGMKSMRENALEAVAGGGTSLEEILRITTKE